MESDNYAPIKPHAHTHTYTHSHTHTHTHTHMHTHMHTHTHTHTHTRTHTRTHAHTHTHVHTHMHMHAHTCTRTHTHTHTHTHTRTHAHAHTHTHTQALGLLINLVEHSAKNRTQLETLQFSYPGSDPTTSSREDDDVMGFRSNYSSLRALLQLFLKHHSKAEEATIEVGDVIIMSSFTIIYFVLLL